MALKSTANVRLNINARCQVVYPREGSKKNLSSLKTVGIGLNRAQAIHLARLLLVAAQDWDDIGLTVDRKTPRKSDGTYQVTVTGG